MKTSAINLTRKMKLLCLAGVAMVAAAAIAIANISVFAPAAGGGWRLVGTIGTAPGITGTIHAPSYAAALRVLR